MASLGRSACVTLYFARHPSGLKANYCRNFDIDTMGKSLIVTYISDELEDSGHEARHFLEELGAEYIDEDDPQMYFKIPDELANAQSLGVLAGWSNQIARVEIEDDEGDTREDITVKCRKVWSS